MPSSTRKRSPSPATPSTSGAIPRDPVLVVEDHDETREMITAMLEFQGYAVETASNGAEALEKLRACHPCLILLDLKMPVMDGWTFRRKQLQDPEARTVPVLVLSAYDNDERTARLHADGSLTKPLDFPALLHAVEETCARS